MYFGLESAGRVATKRRQAPLSQQVVSGASVLTDALAVIAAAVVAHIVLWAVRGEPLAPPVAIIFFAALLLVLTFNAAGLYRFPAILRPGDSIRRALSVILFVALSLFGLAFALKVSHQFSRVWAFSWLASATVLIVIGRFVVAGSLRKLAETGRIGRKIVIYGAGSQGEKLIRRIEELNEPWNRIVGVFDDRVERTGGSSAGYPVLGGLDELVQWAVRDRPDEILIALPWGAENRILDVLRSLAVVPANVRLASEFQRMDAIQGRTNQQFGLPMLNAYEKPLEGWGRIWKRMFDVTLATATIVAVAPLMLLIALLIRLESPGPVLFRQPRYGFNNRLIMVYKFRTMRVEATDALGTRLTKRHDVRVTRVGSLLRRFSLDEVPQLLNVIKGEMSLVGPRPHAVRTTAGGRQCDQVVDQYAVRHKVKPGITGWAQVNGWRGTMETEEHLVKRLEHDLYYIKNWSPLFDIKILLLTVWSVISGRNSF